jgi:hypothetical protein
MADQAFTADGDLSGTVDERIRQLAAAEPSMLQSTEWLLRQLQRALEAWAADETQLDIDTEAHVDY